jgi:protein-disulfide isomerase
MRTSVKSLIAAAATVVALVLAGVVWIVIDRSSSAGPAAAADVIRSDSHVLDQGSPGSVTVVEFLDFECEACGAFYPIVEDLRERYAGDITYVVRYFPLPGHANSTNAALAAEAAAQQGEFEAMYHRLFQTQAAWGEGQESRADLFREYAVDLGLDIAAYDAAVADPATLERVRADSADGQALGVSSTPSFVVNGEPVVLEQWTDLATAIESAR